MRIKRGLKAYVGVVVLFWMMFCNLSFSEAEIKITENEKNVEIKFLWSPDGSGESVSLFSETVQPLKVDPMESYYSAVLMSEWSPVVKAKIVDRLIREGELPEVVEALKGTSYQVELDAKEHKFRIVRLGMVDKQNQIRWLGTVREEEWEDILDNPLQEQLSELFVWIYNNREVVWGSDRELLKKGSEALPSEGEKVWEEFDRSSWGRYFFLPSELKIGLEEPQVGSGEADELDDVIIRKGEIIQVLVRSDWSLRAQKEAPEGENWWRKKMGLPVVFGLDKTQNDYMIWEIDFKNMKRRYVAGVYLAGTGERIFKEENLQNQPWESMGNPKVAGRVAAWLLSHPVEAEKLPLAMPAGQGEVPLEWAGWN